MDDQDRLELAADLKTAALSGGGVGLALLGFSIPLLSIAGFLMAYFGLRSARPDYTVGRVFAYIGMGIGLVGSALLLLEVLGLG